MATHKDVLERQKEVSDKISSQARTLAVSILAISWLLLVPGKDGPLLQHLPNRALLIAAGVCSLLALAFDFFQYVFSYRTVQDTLNNPNFTSLVNPYDGGAKEGTTYEYDYKSKNYKWQNHFFSAKQVALVISAVALVIAIAVALVGGMSGQPSTANSSIEEPSGLARDVASIRVHVEEIARNTSQPPSISASGVAREVLVLPAEGTLNGPSWALIAGVSFALLGAGVFLLRLQSTTGKAVGASLIALGTLSAGGFTLVKDLKVDSLVKLDIDKLFEYTRVAVRQSEIPGPERIASIEGFLVGEESKFKSSKGVEAVQNSGKVVDAVDELKRRQGSGYQVVLLVIGATDRLPIRGAKNQRFETNVGLARARAETVRHALLERCRQSTPCALSDDQVISLVSGPKNTPLNSDSIDTRRATEGFDEDRRVDVWALWTRKSEVQK